MSDRKPDQEANSNILENIAGLLLAGALFGPETMLCCIVGPIIEQWLKGTAEAVDRTVRLKEIRAQMEQLKKSEPHFHDYNNPRQAHDEAFEYWVALKKLREEAREHREALEREIKELIQQQVRMDKSTKSPEMSPEEAIQVRKVLSQLEQKTEELQVDRRDARDMWYDLQERAADAWWEWSVSCYPRLPRSRKRD